MPSFTRRIAFLQFRLFLSDKAWTFDESMIILHKTCQIPKYCPFKKLLASVTALETFVDSSPSPAIFLLTRITLHPLSGEILYHDSVSVIVPGFTSFVEDLVIRCYQVT